MILAQPRVDQGRVGTGKIGRNVRKHSSGKTILIALGAIAAIVMVGAGFSYMMLTQSSDSGPSSSATVASPKVVVAGAMTEEERVKYVADHVRVSGVTIGPDKMPDTDKPVPGLLRVAGEVSNSGPKVIQKVTLAVFPQDEAEKVLGSYYQNIAPAGGLKPNEVQKFNFQIPKRPNFGGKFRHSLRWALGVRMI